MMATFWDSSDLVDGSVPVEPERGWDLPAGPRNGRAAALRVPCSDGPASMLLEPSETSVDTLMETEPSLEPLKFMEAGADWTAEARAAVHELDRPIEPWVGALFADHPPRREVSDGRPRRR
jgi:hypothetical protein